MSTVNKKFDYSKFKNFQPVHISTYIGHKEQVKSFIGKTYNILKIVSFRLNQLRNPKVRNQKIGKVYKSEGGVHLSSENLKIIQGFLQAQHISAKLYLRKVIERGAWEWKSDSRAIGAPRYQRKVTHEEAISQKPTWGKPIQPRGWTGTFPENNWPLYWGGRQVLPEPNPVRFNWGRRKRHRDYGKVYREYPRPTKRQQIEEEEIN